MSVRAAAKRAFRSLGYSVSRYEPKRDPEHFLRTLLARERIDTVLDVGANTGQYARALRKLGFAGTIVSFEPLAAAYAQLEANARADGRWVTSPYALGASEGNGTIHVAGNSWSSSLLPMLPAHTEAAPASAPVGTTTIEIRTLDSLVAQLCPAAQRIFLKIDTQGFTLEVLRGAQQTLASVFALNVELSLTPLYAGEPLIDAIVSYLRQQHFRPVHLVPEFVTESGEQLQVNGLFVRG